MCQNQGHYLEDILYLCTMMVKSVKTLLREQLKDYDMTVSDFEMLIFLAKSDCNTPTDIVRERGYSRSLVSKMIDRLMKQGYVETTQDKEDRRIVHLTLTDRADELVKILVQINQRVNTLLSESVSAEDMDIVWSVLTTVRNSLQTLHSEALEDNK